MSTTFGYAILYVPSVSQALDLAAQAVPFEYEPISSTAKPPGAELTLTTSEVDALYGRAVAAGAIAVAEPHDVPWGQRVAYVRDLNGFAVGLATPME